MFSVEVEGPLLRGSGDRVQKIHGAYAQRMRQLDDIEQTDVAFAPLDSADVIAMQIGQFRQMFLRQPALDSQFTDAPSK